MKKTAVEAAKVATGEVAGEAAKGATKEATKPMAKEAAKDSPKAAAKDQAKEAQAKAAKAAKTPTRREEPPAKPTANPPTALTAPDEDERYEVLPAPDPFPSAWHDDVARATRWAALRAASTPLDSPGSSIIDEPAAPRWPPLREPSPPPADHSPVPEPSPLTDALHQPTEPSRTDPPGSEAP